MFRFDRENLLLNKIRTSRQVMKMRLSFDQHDNQVESIEYSIEFDEIL